ncbi:unnamed protein product [Dibothriocephalus latus]|uniref:Uncharacterized protein n=1 Tax=Dibothriocephalus latus TaxID=60516 RepID=A0A3P7R578_DIBLA|nr:unnamed protein product [Dibothriocephalus latus]
MGLPETQEYINRLKKAEKSKEAREQRQLSASNRQPISVGVLGQLSDSKENVASTESGGKSSYMHCVVACFLLKR